VTLRVDALGIFLQSQLPELPRLPDRSTGLSEKRYSVDLSNFGDRVISPMPLAHALSSQTVSCRTIS
jgi:hypothetical protein